jgi:hypothetical protein
VFFNFYFKKIDVAVQHRYWILDVVDVVDVEVQHLYWILDVEVQHLY